MVAEKSKWGKLTVMGTAPSYTCGRSRRARWLCQCDCGAEQIATRLTLKKGQCAGCAYQSRPQSTKRKSAWQRSFDLRVLNRRRDGILVELSLVEYIKIASANCSYCGEPPMEFNAYRNNKKAIGEIIYTNGVDRVNTAGPYSVSNCVAACWACNRMKGEMSVEQMLNHFKKVLAHGAD